MRRTRSPKTRIGSSTTNNSGPAPKVHTTAILRHGAELTTIIRQVCGAILYPDVDSIGRLGWVPRTHMTDEHLKQKAIASHAFNKKWLSELDRMFGGRCEDKDNDDDTGWSCAFCAMYKGTYDDVLDHEQRCRAVPPKKRRMFGAPKGVPH